LTVFFFCCCLGIHTDISYEHNPAALSILKIDLLPRGPSGHPVGGDTIFWSGYEAFSRLSVPMQKFVENLSAIHSGEYHKLLAKKYGRPIRREFPPDTVHPIVR
jgi:sulfonate dioxygenase